MLPSAQPFSSQYGILRGKDTQNTYPKAALVNAQKIGNMRAAGQHLNILQRQRFGQNCVAQAAYTLKMGIGSPKSTLISYHIIDKKSSKAFRRVANIKCCSRKLIFFIF